MVMVQSTHKLSNLIRSLRSARRDDVKWEESVGSYSVRSVVLVFYVY